MSGSDCCDDPPPAGGDWRDRQLGRYRLLRSLGAGGMAEVFLALAYGASGFEKRVALKLLLPQLRHNARLQRLLIEEARLGARLQHRNLVQVHELGTADGTYYLRMDYVDGADLQTLVARAVAPLPIPLALLVAEEVTLALRYVHRATDDAGRPLGLVHRDISPSNVLVSRAGEVKLADFGVAKSTMLADVTRANIRKGKYAYMSPEQVAGAPLTARSDQFSLGVMLIELCCGKRPYDREGDTPLETMERIRAARPPAGLDDLAARDGEDLAALIGRCLAARADDRFDDDDELHAAIGACRRARARVSPIDLARWVSQTAE